jgi:hypothetical protein
MHMIDTPPSLRALTEKLFDYAGMFPPAACTFEQALEHSLRFSTSLTRPWLVGTDLVLQFQLLDSLSRASFAAGRPLTVCMLADPIHTPDAPPFFSQWDDARSFTDRTDGKALVTGVEAKCTLSTHDELRDLLARIEERDGPPVALEPEGSHANSIAWLEEFGTLLEETNRRRPGRPVLLKMRGNVLSISLLSELLPILHARRVGLKATQLLHHPIIERARYGNVLGFLNLSLAWVLAHTRNITTKDLVACLEISHAGDLSFTGESIFWNGYTLTAAEIRDTRMRFPLAIGSCSIHEPDEDLARLWPLHDCVGAAAV